MRFCLKAIPLAVLFAACTDLQPVEDRLDDLEARMTKIEQTVNSVNLNSVSIKKLISDKTVITSYETTEDGYVLTLSDGTEIRIYHGLTSKGIVPIVAVDNSGNWVMSVDGGKTFSKVKNAVNVLSTEGLTPYIAVDSEGYWTCSLDGGTTSERILNSEGSPISAVDGRAVSGTYSFFTYADFNPETSEMDFILTNGTKFSVPVKDGFGLNVKGFVQGTVITLDETLCYEAALENVQGCFFELPEGWKARLTDSEVSFTAPSEGVESDVDAILVCTSDKGLLKKQKFNFHFKPVSLDKTDCKPWNDYLAGNADNVLMDFSYAGYKHGEVAPPDVYSLGYKVYNVCDYGAIPNDDKSDRDAFLRCMKDAFKVDVSLTSQGVQFGENKNARVIIYFPEGEFILHTEEDNNADSTSNTILVRSGNWVLKGAGRGKTILRTTAPGYPGPVHTEKPWAGIPLMTVTCWNGWSSFATPSKVVEDVHKGDFSVKVSSTTGIAKDAWVVISANIVDDTYVDNLLKPCSGSDLKAAGADIYVTGAKYQDFHQVKSVEGNIVTFYEPVMYEIDSNYDFELKNYVHYENVGFEDFTFKSCCPQNYLHHESYLMDSGYCMLMLRRLVNSWVRRVDCDSVTEGVTFDNSANCSAYDMECYGTRGHALVRASGSSRVFIGATYDHSDGVVNDGHNPKYASRSFLNGAGQLHGQGVNGACVGSVCWRNIWGEDACFESHAQQPHASLFDCCKGGWMIYRVGGMLTSCPSHLDDLIIWNMNSTMDYTPKGKFNWWNTGQSAWKVMPPTIIGFHGGACTFESGSVKMDYSNGTAVLPESLYEAQVRKRLGHLPAWLNSIKNLYQTQ